jgi:glycosyltransferase involved in cell wall biosynthesis
VISVLVPTRNRPSNVKRLLDSAFETAYTEVEFLFYVDDDDPTRDETVDLIYSHGAHVITGERIVLSETWNELASYAQHAVMMHCGDDIVFRSDGWDQRVLDEFARFDDRIVFVHGRDGYQDANIGTHGFLHRNWVDAVGYFVPPYFSSDYNDLWLTEVADALDRRRYLPEIYTEHMHPVIGKGTWDQTHQERLERHQRDDVATIYRMRKTERDGDVAKLRTVIDNLKGE